MLLGILGKVAFHLLFEMRLAGLRPSSRMKLSRKVIKVSRSRDIISKDSKNDRLRVGCFSTLDGGGVGAGHTESWYFKMFITGLKIEAEMHPTPAISRRM